MQDSFIIANFNKSTFSFALELSFWSCLSVGADSFLVECKNWMVHLSQQTHQDLLTKSKQTDSKVSSKG